MKTQEKIKELIEELTLEEITEDEAIETIIAIIKYERKEGYNEGYLDGAKQERLGIEERDNDIRKDAIEGFVDKCRVELTGGPSDEYLNDLVERYLESAKPNDDWCKEGHKERRAGFIKLEVKSESVKERMNKIEDRIDKILYTMLTCKSAYLGTSKAREELSTLIAQERKDAVEGFWRFFSKEHNTQDWDDKQISESIKQYLKESDVN